MKDVNKSKKKLKLQFNQFFLVFCLLLRLNVFIGRFNDELRESGGQFCVCVCWVYEFVCFSMEFGSTNFSELIMEFRRSDVEVSTFNSVDYELIGVLMFFADDWLCVFSYFLYSSS